MKLSAKFSTLFTEHPASVDETYTEHFRTAMHFSGQMAKASMACALHAFVPSMCCTTGSDKIKELYGEVTNRGPQSVPVEAATTLGAAAGTSAADMAANSAGNSALSTSAAPLPSVRV